MADFCRDIVGLMGLALDVDGQGRQGGHRGRPDRAGPPILLSGAAAVLNSLEYLANKAFRTGQGEDVSSIVLDSDQYRQHREAELVGLLAQMASQKVLAQRDAR